MASEVSHATATETPIPAKDRLGRNQRPHDAKGKFARRDGSPGQQSVAQRLAYGKDLLPHVDGRSLTYKRYREIVAALAADQGGADTLSAARAQLIRRFAAASVLAEQMETRLASGEPIDISEHALLCSSLVRLGQRIGIDRRVIRDVTPSVADYVAHINAEAAE